MPIIKVMILKIKTFLPWTHFLHWCCAENALTYLSTDDYNAGQKFPKTGQSLVAGCIVSKEGSCTLQSIDELNNAVHLGSSLIVAGKPCLHLAVFPKARELAAYYAGWGTLL